MRLRAAVSCFGEPPVPPEQTGLERARIPSWSIRSASSSGREAYASRAWLDAYTALSDADQAASLGADDLELLATSASMIGRMDDSLSFLERGHDACLEPAKRSARRAAHCGSASTSRFRRACDELISEARNFVGG